MRKTVSRRDVLGGLSAAPFIGLTRASAADDAQFPVQGTFIEHVSAVVRDVRAATVFHSKLFNPAIMTEREPTPLRCYVDLRPGYFAFGSRANQERVFFDHFCVLIQDFDPEALAAALTAEGLPQRSLDFTLFPDLDGIGVQLYKHPGGWFPTVVSMPPLVAGPSLVTPHGLEHVVLRVQDVDQSVAFYRRFFGRIDRRDRDRTWLAFPDTRLGIEHTSGSAEPGIDHVRVRVAPFETAALRDGLMDLGASEVHTATEGGKAIIRFTDPQGLKLELITI